MEVFIGVQVKIKVDDEEVCYCDTNCKWFDNGFCILFEAAPELDTNRPGYNLSKPFETWKFIRCRECLKKQPAEDLG